MLKCLKKIKRLNILFSLFFILNALFFFSCTKKNDNYDAFSPEEENNLFVYNKCKDCVVKIYSYDEKNKLLCMGSGIVVTKKKLIMTNYHVVKDAKKITVQNSNNEFFKGVVLITDREEDVALCSVTNITGLKEIEFSRRSARVGEKCISLSFPLNDIFLSTGFVGSITHPVRDSFGNITSGMIASDARVLSGSSGGALLNKSGELIGMNFSVFNDKSSSSMSFAYKADDLNDIIKKLLNDLALGYKQAQKGSIDAYLISMRDLREFYPEPKEYGVLVADIIPGGNCDEVLRIGDGRRVKILGHDIYLNSDIIVEIDGFKIRNTDDIYSSIKTKREGDEIEIKFLRNDKLKTANIKLSMRDDDYVTRFL